MAEPLRYGRGHMCAGCEFERILHGDCIQIVAQSAIQLREQRMAVKSGVEPEVTKKLAVEKPPES